MNNIFDDCFLLIPTRNRPHFLKKALNFYSLHESVPKIIIADSSDKQSIILNEGIIRNYSDKMKIEHRVYNEHLTLFNKIHECMSSVYKYQFVAIAADDDYLSLDVNMGAQCLSFLRESEKNAFATGVLVRIDSKRLNPPMPYKSSLIYSILSDSPIKRIEEYCDFRRNRLYGFHRISILKEAINDTLLVIRRELDIFAEYFLYFSLMARGKSFCVDNVGYVFVVHGENQCLDDESLDLPVCQQSTYKEQICIAAELLSEAIIKIDASYKKTNVKSKVTEIIKRLFETKRTDGEKQKRMIRKYKTVRIILFPILLSYYLAEKLNFQKRAIVRSPDELFNLKMQKKLSSFRRIFTKINQVN